jgi:hypothetical protein
MKKDSRSHFSGQSMVEFALIVPIFVFLAVVIFDFGRAVYYYNAIHNVAREIARYDIIKSIDNYYDVVNDPVLFSKITAGLDPDHIVNIDIIAGTPEYVAGQDNPTVQVTVEYCFEPVTPLVEKIINSDCSCGCNHILLSSISVMRTEVEP